jgi:hypothetical protein
MASMKRDHSQEAVFAVHSLCLGTIRSKAEWVMQDVKDLKTYCNLLVSLPDWDTEAEWAINAAYVTLEAALPDLEAAHKKIKDKRAQAEIRKAKEVLESAE